MSRFENKKYVVTGGTSGIGRATVDLLRKEGAAVVATGTNADRIAQLRSEGIEALSNDASDPEAAKALADWVRERFGTIHGIFFNAGLGQFQPIDQLSKDAFDYQMHINVMGPLLQVRHLAPLLEDGGAMVFNTSVVNELGLPGASVYSATKGAVRSAVRALAAELAGRGIRVNAVSPGPIETDFFARTGMPQEAQQEVGSQILSRVPLGRFGKASEIATVAAFLLSSDASFMTGAEVPVDGGMAQL